MGSAAAFHLARRGARVLGLDRFTPPHTLALRTERRALFAKPTSSILFTFRSCSALTNYGANSNTPQANDCCKSPAAS